MALFRKIGDDHYKLADADHGIEFDVTHIRRDRHDLIGELSVSCGILGARAIDGVLSIGKFNFSSTRERRDEARRLGERARTDGVVDWAALLEELCQRILAADHAGQPAVLLHTLPRPTAADIFDIEGLRLYRKHPVIVFGDGGSLKSYLALFLAGHLARLGHNVLFADWELAGDDHRDRLERIFGDMPHIFYARCDRPLVFEADRLARLREKHDIHYLICDSVGFAADGPPEAADVATRYFQAMRRIGLGSLNLAHTNRSEKADEKPFGSTFWHNSARATWFAKRADESSDDDRLTIGLFNKKANLGPRMPAVGYQFTFDAERTDVRRVNVADVDDLADKLPIWQRVRQAVRRHPQTMAVIAEELGAKVDTIEREVRRKKNVFTRVTLEGIQHIALVERRPA